LNFMAAEPISSLSRIALPSRSRLGGFFSGSYRSGDVRFLLTPIQMETVELAEKERWIQSGARHYSEMLSRESLPSERYMAIFNQAWAGNRERMAKDLLCLAAIIDARRSGEITLVSLARAGTPIGVALKHLLGEVFWRNVEHYSISIIRDRGIDANALRFILEDAAREQAGMVFVDGWTGKGVIARELNQAVNTFNQLHGVRLDARLFVLTDLAGVGVSASDRDYLIPSSLLNATISGLISRSVLNERIRREDFHGCVYYHEFEPYDLSVSFVDDILSSARELLKAGYQPCSIPVDPAPARQRSRQFLADVTRRFGVTDENFIKPGIGEATRVLLRRVPERVIVREPCAEVEHLLHLAREKRVRHDVDPALPYQAVSFIGSLGHA